MRRAEMLAAGEQQYRTSALSRNFAQDVYRLGLEPAQVVERRGVQLGA